MTCLGVISAVMLAGCVDATRRHAPVEGRSFALSLQTLNNPVFQEIARGLDAVIAARGGRLLTADAQFSSTRQASDVAALLDANPAALFLNPVNWEGIRGSLIEARRRKVPVIVVDAPVSDPDLVLCQIASDNVEAGRIVCDALAAARPNARAVILHLSLNRACIERVEGFTAQMSKHPGMKILDIREGKGRAEGSHPVMKELLELYPDLDAVFAVNDPSALGAIQAIEEAARLGGIAVVSVDGSPAGVAAIRSGKLLASAAQSPREIGRIAAQQAYAHLEGKPVERNFRLPVALIDARNAPTAEESRNE